MNKKIIISTIIIVVAILIVIGVIIINNKKEQNPEEILKQYIADINEKKYEVMYNYLSQTSKESISEEEFVTRNKNIYEGIEANNIEIEITEIQKINSSNTKILYKTKMNTEAGNIEFSNEMNLTKNKEKKYEIEWNSNNIFPELNNDYKVQIKKETATRGNILDRNDNIIAGQGTVSSVGIVPGKLGENKQENIDKIAQLLNVTAENINNELSSSWVKDNSFVPIKKVTKDSTELKEQLLQIPGVKITSVTDRVYQYAEATSHLTGYVQNITAEELQENEGKGYNSNSIIGKAGLEKQYEERLKGTDGIEIYIEDSKGNKISTIAQKNVQNGENIKLTIDINIQNKLYNELKNDKGFFVVMQPLTGEILALVSTPSYNANDFVLGLSNDEWNKLKNDESKPMYTRYLQTWCPGSTFKPITGAIGLSTGKITADEEFNYDGLSWQKDSSWGDYRITTLTAYNGSKNLRNALVHSDNIYFAQLALKIGKDTFVENLQKLKFNQNIDFVLNASKSQYSNSDTIEKETLLADSGYGQGQILVNPIHMASIYSAIANEGNMVKPYLEYKENNSVEYLSEGVFTKEAVDTIKQDLIQVVEDEEGTAHDMKINNITIAGKTGTAELKQSKEDEGETLGWFNCFTTDTNNPLLIISMVENASQNGGSHYLIKKIRTLFE